MNYTYILECNDKSLYTGWTTDMERRLAAHNQGKGAKYTRSRLPVRLVYVEVFLTREAAMKREAAIKRLTRKEKQELIYGKDTEEGMKYVGEKEKQKRKEDDAFRGVLPSYACPGRSAGSSYRGSGAGKSR